MYAGSHRRSFPFFLDVVAAISDEGPSMAIDPAKRDGAAIAIQRARLARNLVFANQCAQVFGGSLPSGPSIGARLGRLGRVDPPKAIGHAIDLERIAIDHTGRLSEGGRGSEREGSSQGGQFHRSWVVGDWGNIAANKDWPARFWERPAQDVWEILKKAPLKAPRTLTTMVLAGKRESRAADVEVSAQPVRVLRVRAGRRRLSKIALGWQQWCFAECASHTQLGEMPS
jgi:hypothetical protein